MAKRRKYYTQDYAVDTLFKDAEYCDGFLENGIREERRIRRKDRDRWY